MKTRRTTKKKIALVAIGGNSLIKDRMHQTVRDQYIAAQETCEHIVSMIRDGWTVAIAHGNGPQIGFILRRSELSAHELHEVPLDACGADTQGAIGYALQQNLYNEFHLLGLDRQVVTVITQVEADADDPAFAKPSKPIGSFMTAEQAEQRRDQNGWQVAEEPGRGWRRVVASPMPVRIVEAETIRSLIHQGVIVIAAGGGGIPVLRRPDGTLEGVPAVIDKDRSASLLATLIGAELLLIITAVERVALRYGQPDQEWIDHMSLAEAKSYLAQQVHFSAGSMGPKIEAAVEFLERGGTECIITNSEKLELALAGRAGTHITPE